MDRGNLPWIAHTASLSSFFGKSPEKDVAFTSDPQLTGDVNCVEFASHVKERDGDLGLEKNERRTVGVTFSGGSFLFPVRARAVAYAAI